MSFDPEGVASDGSIKGRSRAASPRGGFILVLLLVLAMSALPVSAQSQTGASGKTSKVTDLWVVFKPLHQ